MNIFKRAVAVICAVSCILSIAGTLAIATEENGKITVVDSCTLFVDRDSSGTFLCGVPVGSTAEGIETLLKGQCEFSKSGTLSTGDKVTLYSDGKMSETANVIIFGDVNGDMTVNAKDVIHLKKALDTKATDSLLLKSYDIDANGSFTSADISALSDFITSSVESISVVGTPERSSYYEGEEFSKNGIFVNATYTNGKVISYADGISFSYKNGDAFSLGDTYVDVIFKKKSTRVSVSVQEINSFEARITMGNSEYSVGVEDSNVQLESTALKAEQKWQFVKQGDGSYEIKHVSSGLLLAVDGTVASEANVKVSADTNSDAQRWMITKTEDGAYTLCTKTGNFALDVYSGKLTDGANIWLYNSNKTSAQLFDIELISELEKRVENEALDIGNDMIASISGAVSGKNLDISSDNVLMRSETNVSSQLWRFSRQSDGSYAIISQASGKHLDVQGGMTSSNANVQVYSNVSSASQRWFILQGENGYIFVPKCSDEYVLEIENGSTIDGASLHIGKYTGKASCQQFTVEKLTQDYVSYVKPANIGTSFNATIKVGSKRIAISDSNAIVYSASEEADQVWRFERQGDGSYVLVNNRFDKALDVSGASSADNTNIQIYTKNNSNAQKWFIYNKEDKFIFRSALSNKAVMDAHDGASTNLANISLWTLTYSPTQLFTVTKGEMKAMSFNIYCNNINATRIDRVVTMMRKYTPDTIGIQEATNQWINQLNSSVGNIYAIVGCGRDGGTNGEYSAVMYNKHIFNLIDSGTKWLSDTPDAVSRYPGSSYNRIFTYALLERKDDGRRMLVINTHLDHPNGASALRARQYGVIQSFINGYGDYPTLITGDFNDTPGTQVYNTVVGNGFLDSAKNASTRNEAATFTNYGADNRVLDYAFFSSGDYDLQYYKVCNEKINGDFPSDHHPVYTRYRLK